VNTKDCSNKENIQDFWRNFQESCTIMRRKFLHNEMEEVFEYIESILAKYGYDFAFELTVDNQNDIVLSFSPEGIEEVSKEINQLVDEKPFLLGWKINKYIQPKPIEDAFVILNNMADVNLQGICFLVFYSSKNSISLKVISKVLNGYDDEDVQAVVSTLLWHILGEEFCMKTISEILPIKPNDNYKSSDLVFPETLLRTIETLI
jgi:hypothetical protein